MAQEINIKINQSNPIDLKAKKEAIQKIAILNTDVITFLGELASSQKAVNKLMNNQNLIRKMVL